MTNCKESFTNELCAIIVYVYIIKMTPSVAL